MTKQPIADQVRMFGVPVVFLEDRRNENMSRDAATFGRAGVDARLAMSLVSDAQEAMARGLTGRARELMNQAKFFLGKIMDEHRVPREF